MESELTNSEKIVHNIINDNKYIIGYTVVLISFYLSNYINNITDVVNLIDSPIIKILLFAVPKLKISKKTVLMMIHILIQIQI